MNLSFLIIDSVSSFRKNCEILLGICAEYNLFRIESMLQFKPELAEEMLGPNLDGQINAYNKSIALNQPYEGFIEKFELLFQGYFKYFVIILNNIPIGQASIIQFSKSIVILHWVYVKPDYRKKLYGFELLKKIIQVAKIDGFSFMYLETIPTLTEAIQLYKKFGFKYCDNYETTKESMEMAKKFELIFMKFDLQG